MSLESRTSSNDEEEDEDKTPPQASGVYFQSHWSRALLLPNFKAPRE